MLNLPNHSDGSIKPSPTMNIFNGSTKSQVAATMISPNIPFYLGYIKRIKKMIQNLIEISRRIWAAMEMNKEFSILYPNTKKIKKNCLTNITLEHTIPHHRFCSTFSSAFVLIVSELLQCKAVNSTVLIEYSIVIMGHGSTLQRVQLILENSSPKSIHSPRCT